jgi:hypothetical protein
MMKEKQIREEYSRYLVQEGRENGPHSAHPFALQKIGDGYDYLG